MPRRNLLLTALGLAVMTAAGWHTPSALWGGGQPRLPPPRPTDDALPAGRWQGTASCAAAACHHGNGPRGGWRSEYTTWANHDSHARAYEVLFLKRSVRMAERLKLGDAHKADLCLSCHVHPDFKTGKALHAPRFTVQDGVGCESCHGPAENWLTEHYRDPWRKQSHEYKKSRGMRDTKSLLGRVQVCVGCHVGAPGMDVNHDLIAAGHPRLNFEFAAYHALMPHHWRDEQDKRGRPDFEARAWAVGQVVSAREALRLLESRTKEVWPEFAEYDCSACHHDLKDAEWRRKQDFGRRKPGTYPWGSWYQGMVPAALSAEGLRGTEKYRTAIAELRQEMEVVIPTAKTVAEKSRVAATALDPLLKEIGTTGKPLSVPEVFRAVALAGEQTAAASWDDAAQYYLALAALHSAWKESRQDRIPDGVRPALRDLASQLRFPRGFDSPRDFQPHAIRAKVEKLTQALK